MSWTLCTTCTASTTTTTDALEAPCLTRCPSMIRLQPCHLPPLLSCVSAATAQLRVLRANYSYTGGIPALAGTRLHTAGSGSPQLLRERHMGTSRCRGGPSRPPQPIRSFALSSRLSSPSTQPGVLRPLSHSAGAAASTGVGGEGCQGVENWLGASQKHRRCVPPLPLAARSCPASAEPVLQRGTAKRNNRPNRSGLREGRAGAPPALTIAPALLPLEVWGVGGPLAHAVVPPLCTPAKGGGGGGGVGGGAAARHLWRQVSCGWTDAIKSLEQRERGKTGATACSHGWLVVPPFCATGGHRGRKGGRGQRQSGRARGRCHRGGRAAALARPHTVQRHPQDGGTPPPPPPFKGEATQTDTGGPDGEGAWRSRWLCLCGAVTD